MKKCTGCLKTKPLSEFGNRARSLDGKQAQCKSCHKRVRVARVSRKHPDLLHKLSVLKWVKKYGTTFEEWNKMLSKQGGLCPICGLPPSEGRDLVIDHCHKTGKIRGLLCSQCNSFLGLAYESTETLYAAIRYLDKHNGPR